MYIEVRGEKTFYSNGNGSPAKDAPAVVFVHGAGLDHSVWVMPARYFARHGYRVCAVDLPAHGRSQGPALNRVEAMSDWLCDLMTALEMPVAALVGHSLGSLVALDFAARYPQKCRALALLGTSTPMTVGPPLLAAAQDNDHEAIDMANTWSHSHHGLIGSSENPGTCMAISAQRLLEATRENVYFADFTACNEFSDGEALAAKVSAPALVIIGAQDKMAAPVRAKLVADNLKNCDVVTLSPCGHSMLSEQPNAVLDVLARLV